MRYVLGLKMTAVLTQGGSLYDITVGTVVDINIHSMMLFYLHTAGEGKKIHLEDASSNALKRDSGSALHACFM